MAYSGWLAPLWDDEKTSLQRPVSDVRGKIEKVFEDFNRGLRTDRGDVFVRSNVSETDKEVCVTAELPGIDQKDIDVAVSGSRITIKGKKKSEKEEKGEEDGREFHRMERTSGSFERSLTLPFEIDGDAVQADFKDGVLTVTIPKPAEMMEKTKKIEIKQAT